MADSVSLLGSFPTCILLFIRQCYCGSGNVDEPLGVFNTGSTNRVSQVQWQNCRLAAVVMN